MAVVPAPGYPWTPRQRRVLSELHPDLRGRVEHALESLGYRLVPICGHRPNAEQARLFAQGRTTPGRIVTHAPPGYSPHNYAPSLAVDLCLNVARVAVGPHPDDPSVLNAWETRKEYPEALKAWEDLGLATYDVGLEWGGRWTGGKKDRPHVELLNWRSYIPPGQAPK